MNILHSIGAGIASIGLFIGSLFGFTPGTEPQEEALGSDTQTYFGGQTYTLAGSGVSSAATSFSLTSFTLTQNGKKIQDSELADTFYITFEPGSRSRQEFASCTTVVQNGDDSATISGCVRGLSPIAPYTASTSLQFPHNGGSYIIFGNSPQFYDQFTAKGNDETITGQWTFTTFPITPSSSPATATTSGVVELATGGEAASSTLTGDIGRLALGTNISTSTPPSSGNVIPVTGDDGKLNPTFLGTFTSTTTIGAPFEFASGNRVDIYTSTTSTGTWTKPQGAKFVEVIAIGGGGGGGGGGIDTSNFECGGGGGGGGFSRHVFLASDISSSVSVGVGAGGAGGNGASNGANGGTASSSVFGGTLLKAEGGTGGGGGTSGTAGAGGAGGAGTIENGSTGGNGTGGGAAGIAASNAKVAPTGGGGAGSATSGGNGGAITLTEIKAGGAGAVGLTFSGSVGVSHTITTSSGTGGGGAGASNDIGTSSGGTGGAGARYGGGGGGGGGQDSGSTGSPGSGGRGGDGVVVVISYF